MPRRILPPSLSMIEREARLSSSLFGGPDANHSWYRLPLAKSSDLSHREWTELEEAMFDPWSTWKDLIEQWGHLMMTCGGVVMYHKVLANRAALMTIHNVLHVIGVRTACQKADLLIHCKSKLTRLEFVGSLNWEVWGRDTPELESAHTNHLANSPHLLEHWESINQEMPTSRIHHAAIAQMATCWEKEHNMNDVPLSVLVTYAKENYLCPDRHHPAQVLYDDFLRTLEGSEYTVSDSTDGCYCYRHFCDVCWLCRGNEAPDGVPDYLWTT